MKKITYNAYILNSLLIIGIFLTFLSVYFIINYSGFCFAKMRYLSDQEKIKSAFDYHNFNRIPQKLADKNKQNYKYIEYESFDKYYKENSDCCQINPGGPYELPPPSLWDRLLGYHSGDVIVINYKARYLDRNNQQKITPV